ncbi:hypothetical protein [Streptomyces malaysiensis]
MPVQDVVRELRQVPPTAEQLAAEVLTAIRTVSLTKAPAHL